MNNSFNSNELWKLFSENRGFEAETLLKRSLNSGGNSYKDFLSIFREYRAMFSDDFLEYLKKLTVKNFTDLDPKKYSKIKIPLYQRVWIEQNRRRKLETMAFVSVKENSKEIIYVTEQKFYSVLGFSQIPSTQRKAVFENILTLYTIDGKRVYKLSDFHNFLLECQQGIKKKIDIRKEILFSISEASLILNLSVDLPRVRIVSVLESMKEHITYYVFEKGREIVIIPLDTLRILYIHFHFKAYDDYEKTLNDFDRLVKVLNKF